MEPNSSRNKTWTKREKEKVFQPAKLSVHKEGYFIYIIDSISLKRKYIDWFRLNEYFSLLFIFFLCVKWKMLLWFPIKWKKKLFRFCWGNFSFKRGYRIFKCKFDNVLQWSWINLYDCSITTIAFIILYVDEKCGTSFIKF